ncbi:MAG: hypothetical protein ACYCT6_09015 [bacterium]
MPGKKLVKPFQGNSGAKKDGYINSYIQKYQQPVDKAEREKLNKIKIKETLNNFLHDNVGD